MEPISKARSGHWRVFAARPFEANELVEVQGVMWEMMHGSWSNFRTRPLNGVFGPPNGGFSKGNGTPQISGKSNLGG